MQEQEEETKGESLIENSFRSETESQISSSSSIYKKVKDAEFPPTT